VVEAAGEEFASLGLYGATGEGISYRAGISHPYLLRLFGSKKDLFLAVIDRSFEDLMTSLREGLAGNGAGVSVSALESALQGALEQQQHSALLLQFLAACGDDDIRPVVRARFAELYQQLARLADSDDEEELRAVLERAVFNSATAALRLPEIASREAWARRLLQPS
jgi:AcrR family transcriptional regulator